MKAHGPATYRASICAAAWAINACGAIPRGSVQHNSRRQQTCGRPSMSNLPQNIEKEGNRKTQQKQIKTKLSLAFALVYIEEAPEKQFVWT